MVVAVALGLSLRASAATAEPDLFEVDPVRACDRLALESRNTDAQILIIGIEGTMQYDSREAVALYHYSRARKSGAEAGVLPPLRGWGGLLTDGLLFPLLRDFGDSVHALTFDFELYRQSNEAMNCAIRRPATPIATCASRTFPDI